MSNIFYWNKLWNKIYFQQSVDLTCYNKYNIVSLGHNINACFVMQITFTNMYSINSREKMNSAGLQDYW